MILYIYYMYIRLFACVISASIIIIITDESFNFAAFAFSISIDFIINSNKNMCLSICWNITLVRLLPALFLISIKPKIRFFFFLEFENIVMCSEVNKPFNFQSYNQNQRCRKNQITLVLFWAIQRHMFRSNTNCSTENIPFEIAKIS